MSNENAKITEEVLKELLKNGITIDFKTTSYLSDHKYLESLGYEIEAGGDCSCYCKKLKGLSCSSWGDWGSIFPFASELSQKLFLDMLNKGIITIFRLNK